MARYYSSSFFINHRSRILVIFATVATVGIILLQLYLFRQVFQSHDQHFYQKARTSLYKIAEEMGIYEDMRYKSQMDSLSNMQRFLVSRSEGVFVYRKELLGINSQLTYTEKFFTRRFKVPTHFLNPAASEDSSMKVDVLKKIYLGNLDVKGLSNVNTEEEILLQDQIEKYPSFSQGSEVPQTYFDVEKEVLPFSQRLSRKELENIIFTQTKELNIAQEDIEFCIYRDGAPFLSTENYLKNDREIKLEVLSSRRNSSTLGVKYELGLQFKNVYSHISDLMTPITTLSIILSLIMIGSLGFTVFYVYMEGRIWKIKKGFIDNITHEFKTPVASINLALDLLASKFKEDVGSSEQERSSSRKKYMSIIKDSARKISNQIDTILTLSRLNRNNSILNYQYVDIALLVRQEVEAWKILVGNNEAKKAKIQLNLDDTLQYGLKCRLDDTHFRSVVNNLIDNAYKYSLVEAHISVKVWYKEGWVYISVSDRGIGISSRDVSRIFGNFYRSERKGLGGISGYGLGLSYVKKILALHRAKIYVDTKENEGSTFTIKIKSYKNYDKQKSKKL